MRRAALFAILVRCSPPEETPGGAAEPPVGTTEPEPEPEPDPEPDPDPPITAACDIDPADGQAAIIAAIAACPEGSTVRFPLGASYTVDSAITVEDRVDLVIDGNGATFHNVAPNDDATSPTFALRRATNVTLRNLTVEGSFLPTGGRLGAAGETVRSTNQFNPAVLVYGGQGVWIEDVTANHVWGDGVLVVPSDAVLPGDPGAGSRATDIHVVRLKATTHSRQCVGVADVDGLWIEFSTCVDSWYGGVDLEPDRGVVTHVIHDAHVLDNTFDGYWGYAVAVPTDVDTGQVEGVEIRGNVTLTPPDICFAPVLVVYHEAGTPETPGTTVADIVVEDNVLLTQGDGVSIRDASSGSVRYNTIELTESPTWCGSVADPSVPVRRLGADGVTVSDNMVIGF
ncbi:MAG: hypothetical protein H0V89_06780 [Deltaproteobacteria bacterium]|nr:hypothetical protein [Deltaproteobacteria bacterium]